MPIKTGKELAAACVDVAKNYNTLYVLGAFGWPMNDHNKNRCRNPKTKAGQYNLKPERSAKIDAADRNVFGSDCVCLIKSLLWGWKGDINHNYGGAVYQSNGVPDIGADSMIKVCTDVTNDFSKVQVGELLWMEGHVGIYIGDGKAVECVARWADGVQVTRVWNIVSNDGTPGRYWTKHGKLPYVSYDAEPIFRVTIEGVDKKRAAALVTEGAENGWSVNVEQIGEVYPQEEKPTEPAPEPEEEPVKVESAKSKDNAKNGKYRVNVKESLNMRAGAGTDKPIICKLKPGDIVKCYGYYTGEWLNVVAPNGAEGYCHQGYLDKV